jgi:hypothetical protein
VCWEVTLSLPPGHLRFVTIITHHENVKKNKANLWQMMEHTPIIFFQKNKKSPTHKSETFRAQNTLPDEIVESSIDT